MELFLVDSDCEKMNRMRSFWHNAIVLVGLLLALNLAAFLTELSQGVYFTSMFYFVCVYCCMISRNVQRLEIDGNGNVLTQHNFAETVRRSVDDCLVTLGVKFLNFCIAKSAQFRYVGPLQAQPSFMPLVFWYTLARSVSSLYS